MALCSASTSLLYCCLLIGVEANCWLANGEHRRLADGRFVCFSIIVVFVNVCWTIELGL